MVLTLNCFAQDVNTYIPPRAKTLLPTLKEEQNKIWSDYYDPAYFGALIEHESCISLTHSRCWSPTSQLKTKREEGAGLSQATRAYREDGSLRFDALQEMRDLHKSELKDLSWSVVYQRPDLQMRFMILKIKDNWKSFPTVKDPANRERMADAAYNSGIGSINNRRRACGLSANCDPNVWFGHVETKCTANKPIYGQRSACDINLHHVKDVTVTRKPKYRPYLNENK